MDRPPTGIRGWRHARLDWAWRPTTTCSTLGCKTPCFALRASSPSDTPITIPSAGCLAAIGRWDTPNCPATTGATTIKRSRGSSAKQKSRCLAAVRSDFPRGPNICEVRGMKPGAVARRRRGRVSSATGTRSRCGPPRREAYLGRRHDARQPSDASPAAAGVAAARQVGFSPHRTWVSAISISARQRHRISAASNAKAARGAVGVASGGFGSQSGAGNGQALRAGRPTRQPVLSRAAKKPAWPASMPRVPFGAANTYTWLVSQMSPSAIAIAGDSFTAWQHSIRRPCSTAAGCCRWVRRNRLKEIISVISAIAGRAVRDCAGRKSAGYHSAL